jgi:Fuc2NAc and GlcNAc transferase
MMYWWLVPTIVLFSLVLTACLRQYALSQKIIDIPNARSSHSIPTPRGGGVAIVVSFLISLPLLGWANLVSSEVLIAIGGSGGAVAIIGFMDDHGHIAARWRLLGHSCASVWAVVWLGGFPPINFLGWTLELGWVGSIFGIFYLVWLLNLYNFMDGIDGIASVEAICACLGACLLYWLDGSTSLSWMPLVLAMAVFGFLYWNFPPARIFMGDAGSGFLGIALGVISLQAAWASDQLFWGWLILLGVFIVDATFTLFRRLLRGDKVYEAHRSHAYQYASRQAKRHLPVTLAVVGINLLWLLPIGILVIKFDLDGFLGLIIAYLPLVVLAKIFHAGEQEKI